MVREQDFFYSYSNSKKIDRKCVECLFERVERLERIAKANAEGIILTKEIEEL